MKYYAVIDTNVLVSAMLKRKSVPGSIMELTFEGPITPLVNSEIIKEYRDVLSRQKFHLSSRIVNTIIENIEQKGIFIDPKHIDVELPDPKDRVFYEVVMEGQEKELSYLIAGNLKHFPIEPFIVTPRQMLDIILSDINE